MVAETVAETVVGMVVEMVAIETEMLTADDHVRKKHPVREPMRAMGTKRIRSNCVDTSQFGSYLVVGFSSISLRPSLHHQG